MLSRIKYFLGRFYFETRTLFIGAEMADVAGKRDAGDRLRPITIVNLCFSIGKTLRLECVINTVCF